MVWGGITGRHCTELLTIDGKLNAARYMQEILAPVVVPVLNTYGPEMMLQQDNARPHTARVVQGFLEEKEVYVKPWPANSPDFNPIEHIWDEMECRQSRLPR